MDLQGLIKDALGAQAAEKIADATGVDKDSVGKVIAAGAPLILGQMSKNSSDETEAEKLDKAVEKDHSPSLLENITGVFAGGSENLDGAKILGHVFGTKGDAASEKVAKKTGIDARSVVKILSFVAPIIMSALAKEKKSEGLNAGGLADLLKGQKAPNGNKLMDIASTFLDKDDDGSVVDDLIGMFGK